MVRLGLIHSPEQAPRYCHRVFLRPYRDGETGRQPELFGNALPGKGNWELSLPVAAHELDSQEWIRTQVRLLDGLAWDQWWFDPKSLSTIMGRSPGFVLEVWGRTFWPLYKRSAVIYFLTSWHRRSIVQCLTDWSQRYPDLALSSEHDLERSKGSTADQGAESRIRDLWRRLRSG